MQTSLSAASAVALLVALVLCVAIVLTKDLHGRLTFDGTQGVQKFHTAPTPRVGGVAVFASLVGACAVAPAEVGSVLAPMLVAALPAFAAGLTEDLTKHVSVLDRLLATLSSGVLAYMLTGNVLRHSGLVAIDALLAWLPVAVAVTAVCVGGMSNAINIIDGFNGLAAGVVIIALGAMGAIARQVGDTALVGSCVLAAGAVTGFLLVNWPMGRIFLGDGGAYLLGFLLAWIAVSLVARNPQLSPWAPLLACAYPVLEVAFSIYRKSRRAGSSPGQPDRVHLHMLVYRRVVRARLRVAPNWPANASTSPFAWLYALAVGAWAVLSFRDTAALVAGLVLAAVVYGLVYTRLSKFRWWPGTPRARAGTRAPVRRPAAAASAPAPAAARRPGRPEGPFMIAGLRKVREPAVARPVAVSPPAVRWMYWLLGASSCVVIVEPAPFELIAIALMLLYAGEHLGEPWWNRVRPFSAAMILLLVLFCALQVVPIALQAHSPRASAFYAGVTTMLIMIGVHLGQLHGRGDVRFFDFLAGYCAAALLSAALAIASLVPAVANVAGDVLLWAGRPKVFFKDPNVFGPYTIPAVLVFLHAAGARRGAARLLLVALALVCAAGVIASASRAAWINLAVAVAAYALFCPWRHKAAVALAAVVVAAAAIPVADWLLGAGQDAFGLYSGRMQLQDYDADRFAMGHAAFDLGLRYPAGVGPGEIAAYLGFGPGMDPHNTYLRIWAENGPVALFLFAALLVMVFAHAAQEFMARRGSAALTCALALLLGSLVNATVVDMLHWRHFWVIFAVCLFSFQEASQPRGFAARGAHA